MLGPTSVALKSRPERRFISRTLVDQATLANRENIVIPAHAAHLTSNGTLVNADEAIIEVNNKVNEDLLNPHHVDGMHKARALKSTPQRADTVGGFQLAFL